jgi:hypothetical protein
MVTSDIRGKILGSMWAAMDWDKSRRVFSVASIPAMAPSLHTPNHRVPAWCLFKMAAIEIRPCLSSDRLLFQFNGFVLHERLLTHAGLLPLAYSS